MAAGNGVILALPHIGSWEWGGAFLSFVGLPMTAVAERVDPPELFDWIVRQREEMGLTIVPLDGDSGGVVLKTLRAGDWSDSFAIEIWWATEPRLTTSASAPRCRPVRPPWRCAPGPSCSGFRLQRPR